MSSRREFLATTAALAWTTRAEQLQNELSVQEPWDRVRGEFLIPTDRIYLNIGTLGPQPRVVVDAIVEHTRRVAMSLPPALDWNALRNEIGALLNCDPAGLVFPRNTTEGMNFVANGLELNAGDEIITTNHEHVGGLCCWQLVAKRRNLALKQVDIGDAMSAQTAFDRMTQAITPRTRVVSVSHVNFTNGLIMPVRELIDHCRPRNIIVVVDGAHPPGLMAIDLKALDPDFYASSPHKWLFAAQGTGMLYLRSEWREKLWPTLASGGWDDLTLGAHRFNHMGTMDESRLAGLLAAVRFHQSIGAPRVHARIRELRRSIIQQLASIPRVKLKSGPDDRAFAGMVSFTVDGIPALELQTRLGEKNVRTRVVGEYGYNWMRLSASIYNTTSQIEQVAALIRNSN